MTGTFPNFTFVVPAGKTLVMEQVGMQCFESPPNQNDYRVITTAGGTNAEFIFPSITFGTDVMMNQTTRIYADGGTTITLGSGLSVPSGSFCSAAVSGHLIDPF